ncbi:MAG: YajQ family cyclic di-GMP-binding protein [Armatimonadetes bacterium]|nr:YajQ family cyclic di-GMP-binding protein [Armatimonadota bacterium]
MAKDESFDITTGVDLQEVDNAVNQTRKEITNRYDFKSVLVELELDRTKNEISIHTASEFNLEAIWDTLLQRMVKRGVPIKNLHRGNIEGASGDTVRQTISLQQGIEMEVARSIVKLIKEQKMKKVQAAIQGDKVRISSPSRDDLQQVIGLLRTQDFGVELQFENYR